MSEKLYFLNDPKPTPITLETALADLATTLDAGEMRMVNVALACARLEWSRATPPDGPVVTIEMSEDGECWIPMIDHHLLEGLIQPGACQRFRLVPEGEPNAP